MFQFTFSPYRLMVSALNEMYFKAPGADGAVFSQVLSSLFISDFKCSRVSRVQIYIFILNPLPF